MSDSTSGAQAHYFTTPEGPETCSPLDVTLRGRALRLQTAPGVFSPRALDKGTAVLLEAVPDPEGEELLDLGCGWGPIALALALSPTARQAGARVTAVDVNERSLRLTADNARAAGAERVEALLPEQVPEDRRFTTIWSNPPIRIGKQALHELLELWLPRLAPGGRAWMVVQKNLGADSLQRWLDQTLPQHGGAWDVERASSSKGFRILVVRRTA